MAYATIWMNLKDILPSKINQSQKDKYCMIPLIYKVPGIEKLIETESRMVVARAWGQCVIRSNR